MAAVESDELKNACKKSMFIWEVLIIVYVK